MAKKHKLQAAQRLRLGRHPVQDVIAPCTQSDSPSPRENSAVRLSLLVPSDQDESNPMVDPGDSSYGSPDLNIKLGYESDWECGYDGGINHQISGDETCSSDAEDSDEDEESLCGLEGAELVENLVALKEKDHGETVFGVLMAKKSTGDWKNVEQNRDLGYNGLFLRT